MNNPLIPNFFGLIAACFFLAFLWYRALPAAKSRLQTQDHATAKFFLTLLSILPIGIGIICGFNIFGLFFGTEGPF